MIKLIKLKKSISFFTFVQNFTKILISLSLLILLNLRNMTLLTIIDQIILKKNMFKNKDSITNLYNFTNIPLLNFFSVELVFYFTIYLIFDLVIVIIPKLKGFQIKENNKRKILTFKKILCFIFLLVQSMYLFYFLIPFLYIYDFSIINYVIRIFTISSLVIIWDIDLLEKNHLTKATSLIFFTTIMTFLIQQICKKSLILPKYIITEFFFLVLFSYFIFLIQQKNYIIDIISAKQFFLFKNEKQFFFKKNFLIFNKEQTGLLIKLNQGDISPIIFIINIFQIFINFLKISSKNIFVISSYYFLMHFFNYFHIKFFWNPKKISNELYKCSVVIPNLSPGKKTEKYLEKIIFFTSLLESIYLCILLTIYKIFKKFIGKYILLQIDVSSLIIFLIISSDIQKHLKVLNI